MCIINILLIEKRKAVRPLKCYASLAGLLADLIVSCVCPSVRIAPVLVRLAGLEWRTIEALFSAARVERVRLLARRRLLAAPLRPFNVE